MCIDFLIVNDSSVDVLLQSKKKKRSFCYVYTVAYLWKNVIWNSFPFLLASLMLVAIIDNLTYSHKAINLLFLAN